MFCTYRWASCSYKHILTRIVHLLDHGSRLHISDLGRLSVLLCDHADKWRLLGCSLGFLHPQLNQIECKPLLLQGAPLSWLEEMLSQWLQWPTDQHPEIPSIEALCSSLKSTLVGLGATAETLRIMHEK